MTPIAPHITAFLNERLPLERRASENTRESHAYAFRLLFVFASARLNVAPCELYFEQIDAPLIVAFLHHLETDRGNSPSSRNIRLAAIKSFMRYMQYRLPSALEQIQRTLAIPAKKLTRGSPTTSPPMRCNRFLRPQIPQSEPGSEIAPCCISLLPPDCASQN